MLVEEEKKEETLLALLTLVGSGNWKIGIYCGGGLVFVEDMTRKEKIYT